MLMAEFPKSTDLRGVALKEGITASSGLQDEDNEALFQEHDGFRDRRLSVPVNSMVQAAAAAAADFSDSEDGGTDDDKQEESAEIFRVKSLLSKKRKIPEEPCPQSKRLLSKESFSSSSTDYTGTLTQRKIKARQITMIQKPDEEAFVAIRCDGGKIQHHSEDDALPFPKDVVGTYSCHGVEPAFEEDYDASSKEKHESFERQDSSQSFSTVAKINQDRGEVVYPFANCSRTALFAAYDGHGGGGELVAQYIMTEIPQRLQEHPLFETNVELAFKDTFCEVDEALRLQPKIEPLFSGSTACVVLIREKRLFISNVGDSRAVMARRNSYGQKFLAIDLSIDQNPDSPGEKERIERNGGYVSPKFDGLSARVWLDPDFSQIGLAMSRSLGDHALKTVGVISEPVVTKHDLQDNDDFLIIATDGVWEFIDSAEAVKIVSNKLDEGYGASQACQALIEEAASKWHEHEGDYRDDITALVVKVKQLWNDKRQ